MAKGENEHQRLEGAGGKSLAGRRIKMPHPLPNHRAASTLLRQSPLVVSPPVSLGNHTTTVEVIGVDGLTYSLSDPMAQIDHLPYYSTRLNLTSALQPGALAHIDVRNFIVNYLTKLTLILPHNEGTYSSVVNIVLVPKAINEPTPIPAGNVTKNDRRLLTVRFLPSVIRSPEANAVLESKEIPQRIFSN